MRDIEFEEMLDRLYKFGLDDGDLGFEYWSKVIKYLRELRVKAKAKHPIEIHTIYKNNLDSDA